MMTGVQNISATPAPAASATIAHDEQSPESFFQRRFVQNVLPWLTSVSVHAGIVLLGLLAFTAMNIVRKPVQEQVTPASAEAQLVQGINFPGPTDNPFSHMTQKEFPNDAPGTSLNPGKPADFGIRTGGGSEGEPSILDAGPHDHFGYAGNTIGIDTGPGTGDRANGGPLAIWGNPNLGGAGPVFVQGAMAHRIVYVCDASGSMINKMASLKEELFNAVNSLKPTQNFSCVFFSDSERPDIFNDSLLPATSENKRKAGKFLEGVIASGQTRPLPGIEAAFKQQPELIFLLTDGDFPDNDAVLARIRELNKAHKVRINTIAFVGSSDTDVAFIDLLKTIAKENGGTYKHVYEGDLQK